MERDPHLRMAEMDLSQSVSGAPAELVGRLAMQLLLDDVVQGRLPCPIAFTFRGTRGRVWQMRDLDAPDDVVRSLAQREEAEALVVVAPMEVPRELEGDRCTVFAAECGTGKFDHLVLFQAGPEGARFRICGRQHEAGARCTWLGVAPEGRVEIWVEGIVGAMTTRRGERGGSA